MDNKILNEDIQNMKYLFGYKPGRVISEQDIKINEDKDDNLFLRRRLHIIQKLIDKYIKEVEEEETLFSDEFEFTNNIVSWVVQDLIEEDEYGDDYGDDYDVLTDLIKDNFGEYIISQYEEPDFDDDDDF